jgi:putative membrane protein
MLWIKSLHIVFIASWFAGLFYLPRIYVNLAEEQRPEVRERLFLMAHRLLRFTTILAVPAVLLGAWLLLAYRIGLSGPGNGWMHAKLFFVLVVMGYHHSLYRMLRRFEKSGINRSARWLRLYNEVPVLLLLVIVILVVVKPF